MLTLLAIGYLIAMVTSDEPAEPSMMGRAQMMMFAGFVMLGWVLARRTIRNRKTSRVANRQANLELEKVRTATPSVTPLVDAPAEIQRWQGAMHDLSRDLSAQLENRIATVQSLINQIDAAENLAAEGRTNDSRETDSVVIPPPITGRALTEFIRRGVAADRSVEDMAAEAGVDPGEIRWSIAAMTPGGKVERVDTASDRTPIATSAKLPAAAAMIQR